MKRRVKADEAAALEYYGLAVETGGHVAPDVRCYLIDSLLRSGRKAEAALLIDVIRKQRPDDPDVYSFVGESLEATGDLPAAARWFTVGLIHAIRDFGEDSYEAEDLLVGRRRARQAQALPQDEYDLMAEEALAERSVLRTDDGRVLAGVLRRDATRGRTVRERATPRA